MDGIIRRNAGCWGGLAQCRRTLEETAGFVEKCALIFGPAEAGEGLLETREGQADDVEITAFNARNVAAGAALNGVAAGFVVGLTGGEIAGDFFSRERVEVDKGGLDEGDALRVGKPNQRYASNDGVGAAGKFFEHVASVVGGAGLAEDVAFESDFGVGAYNDGGADGARGHEFGFSAGETLNEVLSGFTGVRSFVNGGREHGEGEAGIVEDFGAADGSGSKNEPHRRDS